MTRVFVFAVVVVAVVADVWEQRSAAMAASGVLVTIMIAVVGVAAGGAATAGEGTLALAGACLQWLLACYHVLFGVVVVASAPENT